SKLETPPSSTCSARTISQSSLSSPNSTTTYVTEDDGIPASQSHYKSLDRVATISSQLPASARAYRTIALARGASEVNRLSILTSETITNQSLRGMFIASQLVNTELKIQESVRVGMENFAYVEPIPKWLGVAKIMVGVLWELLVHDALHYAAEAIAHEFASTLVPFLSFINGIWEAPKKARDVMLVAVGVSLIMDKTFWLIKEQPTMDPVTAVKAAQAAYSNEKKGKLEQDLGDFLKLFAAAKSLRFEQSRQKAEELALKYREVPKIL
ncbi:UNVERIFIED_CONTAM: hypothetical protein HDU68_005739, partial [Siphonaria sp. JEL0065]